ncbi:outer membrane protein [Mangrovibrevibacter kandeliae]|uniref:outer membrane protein n=1 Tax=Mangrovibrevibacter kandeliae TaxID=2968473 RepID=UPI002117537B|nr:MULTISPECIES: outer membrane protein [unclassified Aurantimonas]MCQ8784246.1 porin family protein [Aurantimonas sp. CSK15Z-1]MCW4116912.1 porin family protein [Aurantimonas sp. MSK8Z-1]
MRATKTLLLAGLLAASALAPAGAADLLQSPLYENAPEVVPVEIGNAWYLRVDGAYDFKSDVDASADGGLGRSDGTLQLDGAPDFGVGAGYHFTDMLRADVTGRYWRGDLSGDFSGGGVGGKLRAWEVMANAYVDLGTIAGFTPYIGGGAGAVNLRLEDVSCAAAYACDGSADASGDWRFAYAAMAGVAYSLTQNLQLDVGYRYTHVGEGDLGSFGDLRLSDDGFDRHSIQAGIRYSLW